MIAREILGSHRNYLGWGVALAGLCVALFGVAPAQATTQTFLFTGAEQTFKVPGGVTSIHVVAIGGGGGSSGGIGGVAGQVTGDLTVTPGQTLYVEVGGRGQDGGSGGFNGGGSGAAGGGGASDIRTSPRSAGLSPDHRLIVAAGGGGAGGAGEAGPGGTGGAVEEAGEEAETSGNEGGAAGSQTEGGVGGFGCGGNGSAGSLGEGGTGGSGAGASNSGGGGGGGYYGAGGGGGGCTFGGGGGGGGSSLLPFGGSQLLVGLAAEPEIQITYTLVPPSIELISPTNGATYVQGQAVNAVYFCTPPEGATVATCAGPAASGSPLDTATLGSHTFKVFAEDSDGATEAESVKYTVVAAPVKPTEPGPVVTPPPPPPLPDTTIGTHPKELIKTTKKKVKVKFSFSSPVAGSSFECKLDKGSFEPCSSPKSYKVKLGKHKFSVQAISAAGTDPSAATFPFKVKKKQ
jgi:hypothetical protein